MNNYFFSYPVILSIENHCSLAQQRRMAEIMVQAFGDKLVQEVKHEYLQEMKFPSPEELREKILIKVILVVILRL